MSDIVINGFKDGKFIDSSLIINNDETLDEILKEINTEIGTSGHKVKLSMDENYVMTLNLLDNNDNVLSTDTIDFPIEEMIVNATYANKVLTLTLKNGNVLNVNISDIISGLVSQTDFDEEVTNRKEADDKLQSNIDANTANIKTNAENISKLGDRVSTLEGVTSLTNLTWAQIAKISEAGQASNYFKIGDQLTEDWTENYNGTDTKYADTPWNVAHFGKYTNESDEKKDGMYLEWNYTTSRGLAFCASQALQKFDGTDGTPEGLPAGKYCFYVTNFTNDWGNAKDVFKQKYCYFETTKDIPSGGIISSSTIGNNATWKINTKDSIYNTATTLETIELQVSDTLPDGYTYLGATWGEDVGYGILNHIECVAYGDNTWRDSDLRQWLNSDSENWWEAKTRYNIQPALATTLKGFLYGYSEEFKNQLKTVKIGAYTNTLKEKEGLVYTYDKIFLHSPTQRICDVDNGEQKASSYPEGEPWEYYKKLSEGQTNLNTNGTFKLWNKYEILKRYVLNNKASSQNYFSRSPRRGGACNVWLIYGDGGVSHHYASTTHRCLPACVI